MIRLNFSFENHDQEALASKVAGHAIFVAWTAAFFARQVDQLDRVPEMVKRLGAFPILPESYLAKFLYKLNDNQVAEIRDCFQNILAEYGPEDGSLHDRFMVAVALFTKEAEKIALEYYFMDEPENAEIPLSQCAKSLGAMD